MLFYLSLSEGLPLPFNIHGRMITFLTFPRLRIFSGLEILNVPSSGELVDRATVRMIQFYGPVINNVQLKIIIAHKGVVQC